VAAKYTPEACKNKVDDVVVLSVIWGVEGKLKNFKVIRGLPDGLTEKAIEAAAKIRFRPAKKDKQPVNVRSNVEFSFTLPCHVY
jgi:periplasmic protein TonB